MSHATLDMYFLGRNEPVKAAFWARIRAQLTRYGFESVPSLLTRSNPWDALLTTQGLLLGQTCGYPLMTLQQGRLTYVATPCYEAPGCDGPHYSSAIMVRADDPASSIENLRGRRLAYNASHSQSGYNALRALIAPLPTDGCFFGHTLETGGHAASLHAVATGQADCCATDAVCLALLHDTEPGFMAGLKRVGWTPSAPVLPYVTSPSISSDRLKLLRQALIDVANDPANRDITVPMRLKGVQVLDRHAYDVILDQRNRAARLGVVKL